MEIVLDDWQKEILEAEGNIVLCTGRQVGKTTIFAMKAAKEMLKNPGTRIIIVSLTEDQAKLIIVMILDYLEKHEPKQVAKGKNKPTQNKVVLKNGSSALARPVGTTGDAIRGFTGEILYIDEAAKMPELVWAASKPVLLTTAGKIWMSSTPHSKEGYFWEAFQNKHDRFKVFHISSEEVIKNRPLSVGWTEEKRTAGLKHLEEEKKDLSPLRYGQEYMGLFLDDLKRYFSDELIKKVCILKRPVPYPKKNNYMGNDLARLGGDAITYEIIHKLSENQYIQIENVVRTKQLTTETEQNILDFARMFNIDKIGIDAGAGSLGVGIFDRLMQEESLKRKVVAMNNRAISLDREGKTKQRIFKEDMYDNFLNMLERGELLLLDDRDLIASMVSIQWELTDGQVSKVKIGGNNSHIVEGLIRAAWIAKKEKINKLWFSSM